jgi:hypothetical protein
MRNTRREGTWAGLVSLIIAAALVFSGCTSMKSQKKTSDSAAANPGSKSASDTYYDFGDILIPKEMKVQKKKSFISRTADGTSGVLVLKGKVEVNSLITFFENNMAKDNWKAVSMFKSPRTVLLFNKDTRWSIIRIEDGTFDTITDIYVVPTVKEAESDLFK